VIKLPRLTRQQWIHIFFHSFEGPLLLLGGVVIGGGSLAGPILIIAGLMCATRWVVNLLYWWAINKRPKSGSPDFYQPRFPEPPKEPPDVPRCSECGHPCPACELRAEMTARVRSESGWGKE